MNLKNLFKNKHLNYNKKFKEKFFLDYQKFLTRLHFRRCPEYNTILRSKKINISKINHIKDIPYVPSKIFKDHMLKSIKKKDIFKIMNSSGTSSNNVSNIILDKNTSRNQIKVLSKIVKSLIGEARLPMIIIDSESVLTNRNQFSARVAGIHGFRNFSTDTIFALDENMKIDFKKIIEFIDKYKNQQIIIFGFTYLIYQNFLKNLIRYKKKINLSKGIMIHGGGWKKLSNLNISNHGFKLKLKRYCNIDNIYNYYGMAEQAGSIYFECKKGNLHTSIYNDILIRNKYDFTLSKMGESGIVQVFSLIPESYPGHSILTEDEGVILGENNCGCGIKSKYFRIIGRLKNSEIRGCSDAYK
jgi:phenylacetate-coenzyme A ligase PaaK-like adenylate-forming protein